MPSVFEWNPKDMQEYGVYVFLRDEMMAILTKMMDGLHILESEILSGLVLLERAICESESAFSLETLGTGLPLAVCVAVMVAHKTGADQTYTNATFCSILGIELSLFARAETAFLEAVKFRVVVSGEEYEEALLFLSRLVQHT